MAWIEKVAPLLLSRSKQIKFPIRAFCDKISSESVTKDVPRKDVPTNDAPTHDAPTDDAPDSQVLAEDIDNASFKCKEYFEHNPMTFYDIETEMEKYRALQPTPVHN